MSKNTSLVSQNSVNIKQQRIAALDNLTFGRYSSVIAAKSAIRIGVLKVKTAHDRAYSGFFMRNAQLHPDMVGWVGDSSESLGSVLTSTPTLLSSPPIIGVIGGELLGLKTEAANMATTPAHIISALSISAGIVTITSIDVANLFEKRHDGVLQRIRTLKCSTDFTGRNFLRSEYVDPRGQARPQYEITRDGFAFLAMGFTGTRAAPVKELLITAFNEMEERINAQKLARAQYISARQSSLDMLARKLITEEKAKEEAERANAEYERMVFQAANNAERSHVYEFIAPRYMWPNDKQAAIIRIPGRTKEDATRGWAEMIYIGERRV